VPNRATPPGHLPKPQSLSKKGVGEQIDEIRR